LNLISKMSDSSIDPQAARLAAEAVPGIPRDANGPVFSAPWEAHAFAMALALYQKGLFAWSEWSAMLGEEIKKAQAAGDPDTGENYYHHWLATLERIAAEKGATSAQALSEHFRAWERAMHRTPHGKPIELRADDYTK
jgi:nitrile hydratase accessory protein